MKRILFVDDERNVLDGIQRMLRPFRNQWEMDFECSGDAALQACRKNAFDVVVSDLRMPGMDGAELLGHIRDEFPGTARIVLSGYSDAALSARAIPVAYRVLTKPCNTEDLKNTIERVCTLQELFCTQALRHIIGTIGELPSLSGTYVALSEALRQPSTSLADVSRIIGHDIAMSAKILQLANSAFFGLTQRATSLHHAVSYLGFETIKNLALCSETFRIFTPDPRFSESFFQALQRHSQLVATITGALPLSRAHRDIAIVAALLHDMGTLVLASTMPGDFSCVLVKMRDQGCSQAEAEEDLLGLSHAEIGGYLLGLWGIHNLAVEAIAHHHHPTRIIHDGLDCSVAVYLADLLAHELELHPDDLRGEELSEAKQKDLTALGLLQDYHSYRSLAVEALK